MKFTCYFMFTFMRFLCSSWTLLLTSVPVPCAWSSWCSVSLQPPVQPWLRVLCCSDDLSLCFLLVIFSLPDQHWPSLFLFTPLGLLFSCLVLILTLTLFLVPCPLSQSYSPLGLPLDRKLEPLLLPVELLNFVYSAVVIVHFGRQAADYKIVLMCFMNLEEIFFF